jgi:hypothetical protein
MSERILGVSHQEVLEYNGKKFRSRLEIQTAKTLDELGIPYSYEERKIILQEGFRCQYQKNKVIGISYTPDFVIGPIMLECKGFETPEWKIKKKLLFKWLTENEPNTIFYQIHDARKSLLECLDSHWTYLGYAIQATPKKKKNVISEPCMYDSITQAMEELNLQGKPMGAILRSLTGQTEYVYGYSWKLIKIKL